MQTNRMQHVLFVHRVECENHADENENGKDNEKALSSASVEASGSSSGWTITWMVWWEHLVPVCRDDGLVELDGFAIVQNLSSDGVGKEAG